MPFVLAGGAWVVAAGCPSADKPPEQSAAAAGAMVPATPPTPAEAKQKPADTKAKGSNGESLGKLSDTGIVPIAKMIGQDPPTVQALLGEHQEKGGQRDSCTRIVPVEPGGPTVRVWYRCQHAWQRYADKAGKVASVYVEYENGKASWISLEGLPDKGELTPDKILAAAGLDLPGEPKLEEPAEGVKVWSYFNSTARLRIDGREYRVEVSTVEDEWSRAKVSLILNDHLTDDERAGLIQVDGEKVGAETG